MRVVLSDIGADCIKTGMLASSEVVQAVAQECRARAGSTPLVVDPVMMAKGGHPLLEQDARSAVAEELVPLSALVTPNVPEASVLSGTPIHDLGDMRRACDVILALGAGAVLLKGGHLEGPVVIDLLRTADGSEHLFERPRIATRHTHGTGCTLASAIATGIAEGLTLFDAVRRARDYVQAAIVQAPGFGQGFGPLNHMHGINRPG
jgi:hydroxymethylpyrimidine/phosphomethylpyrimidine kinase